MKHLGLEVGVGNPDLSGSTTKKLCVFPKGGGVFTALKVGGKFFCFIILDPI